MALLTRFSTVFVLIFSAVVALGQVPNIMSPVNPLLRPFYHGVASGDPHTDRVVLHTRVTPDTGFAGEIDVHWVIATDLNFTDVVNFGKVKTSEDWDYTVKIDACGLQPGTVYFYMFHAFGQNSIVGRTKTAPSGNNTEARFAVASCSHYEAGYFHGYEDMAARNDFDAVIHLGDYIYEYGANSSLQGVSSRVHVPSNEITKLADYRMRYSHHRIDPSLMRAHQLYPFIVTWDDHESANNSWATGADGHNVGSQGPWNDRLTASVRAYDEWMPIMRDDPTDTARIWRTIEYGDLLDLLVIDSRIYGRDEQDLLQTFNSNRSMLGQAQFDWLVEELKDTSSTWKLMANQVMFAPLGIAGLGVNADQWDGYRYERDRLIDSIKSNNVENFVVLTGDIHTSFGNEIPDPQGSSVGTEFIVTSLTTTGSPINIAINLIQTFNPHIKYLDFVGKGYVALDVNQTRTQGDWVYMSTITNPTYTSSVAASYEVAEGNTALIQASGPLPVKNPIPAPGVSVNPALPYASYDDSLTLIGYEGATFKYGFKNTPFSCQSHSAMLLYTNVNGTIGIPGDSCISYDINPGHSGQDTIVYMVCYNGTDACDTARLLIDVFPGVFPDTVYASTPAGTGLIVCRAPDNLNGPISSSSTLIAPASGTAVFSSDTCLDYTPSISAGFDTLVQVYCDNSAPQRCDTVVYILSVLPVVNSDTNFFSSLNIASYQGCIGSDELGGPIAYSAVLTYGGSIGTLSLNSDTCFTYQPDSGAYGLDTFGIVLCDSQQLQICDTFIFIGSIFPEVFTDTIRIDAASGDSVLVCLPGSDLPNTGGGIQVLNSPLNGSWTSSNDSCFWFLPDSNFAGTQTLQVVLCASAPIAICDTFIVQLNLLPLITVDTVEIFLPWDSLYSGCFTFNELSGPAVSWNVVGYSGPASVSIFNQRCLNYRPQNGFSGLDPVVFVNCSQRNPDICDTVVVLFNIGAPVGIESPADFQGRSFIVFGGYPNPFKERFFLQYYVERGQDIEVRIYDQQGRTVYQKSIQHSAPGLQYARLEAGSLASGTYMLELRSGEEAYRRRIQRID